MKKSSPRGFRTSRCPLCSLVAPLCVCEALHFVPSAIPVVLLRHPREAERSSGTGFLAMQCLGGTLLEPELLDAWLDAHATQKIALLFPPDGEEALGSVAGIGNTPEAGLLPEILIVPDGSWSEARRMVRKNPRLRGFPRVSPQMGAPWLERALRTDKWVRPCTAEALGQWIAQTGDTACADNLRQALVAFVNAHLKARGITVPC